MSGDLVIVKKDEQFPADLLLLASSQESGLSFVDTMNLDGEVGNHAFTSMILPSRQI